MQFRKLGPDPRLLSLQSQNKEGVIQEESNNNETVNKDKSLTFLTTCKG